MKDYIIMIVTLSLASGFIKALMIKNSLNKEISFVISLVMMCAVLSPAFSLFSKSFDFSVINEEMMHTLDNAEGDMVYKRWLAKTTAKKLSFEIEERIKKDLLICTDVVVPWEEKDGEIVFESLIVTADCDERKLKKIEDYIYLHYSLSSCCKRGSVNCEE